MHGVMQILFLNDLNSQTYIKVENNTTHTHH